MMCSKVLICLLLLAFAAGENSFALSKCDCFADEVPKHCYDFCQKVTQPPPPSYDASQPSTPAPGYGIANEQTNPRPPPPPVIRSHPLDQKRRGPCPNGNCQFQRESKPIPPGFDGPPEGKQPKPPPNSRRRRKWRDYQKRKRRPPGFDGPPEGKQPPPNYPPRCNWRQKGYNSSLNNSPYMLKFGPGGVNKHKPEFAIQSSQYQACLEDGTCGCWGGGENYLAWRKTQSNETATCEPHGCGYLYGSSCGHRWVDLYTDYEGYPGHMRIDFVTKSEILRVMPHIHFDYGNSLFFVEPGFARYILRKHMDLPNLLFYMDEPVLYKMMKIYPVLEKRISGFNPVEISNIFCRVVDQCHFLSKFSNKSQCTIIFKVRYLKHCREKNRTPATPYTKAALFTENEIVAVEAKIPKFKQIIPRIKRERAEAVKVQTKNFATLFTDLPEKVLKQINSFLNESGDKLYELSNEALAEGMIGSANDLASAIVKRLFV